jgi:metal-responsive CopG/Arc/MetJ family transcriptional regulator
MTDNITFVENSQIDSHIDIIIRQTNYTEKEAREKLAEYNYDYVAVIKAYLGIHTTEKKALEPKSLNQEIYKQMRHKLDGVMRDYNQRKDNNQTKLK